MTLSEVIENYRQKIKALYKELFERWITSDESIKSFIIASILIRNNKVLLVGFPGSGKSTLVRLISRALSKNKESLGIVIGAPEKTLQKVLVSTNLMKLLTKGEEDIIVRPVVTARIKFINEINRFSKSVQDALLSLLEEGYIEYGGLRFETPDYICFADMNPFRGDIDRALKSRFLGSCYIELPGLRESKSILDRMIESERTYRRFTIVDTMPEVLSFEELEKIWDDVASVTIPEHIKLLGTMILTSLRICKLGKLDLMPSYMRLPCMECEFANEPCSKIQEPPDERALIALFAYARARAWIRGMSKVDVEDILWSVPYVFAHRVELKPLVKSQYRNPWEFFKSYANWLKETKIGSFEAPGAWLKALALAEHILNSESEELKEIFTKHFGNSNLNYLDCLRELEKMAHGEFGRGDLVINELYKYLEEHVLSYIEQARRAFQLELNEMESRQDLTVDKVEAFIEKIRRAPHNSIRDLEERAYKLLEDFRIIFNLEAINDLSKLQKLILACNVDAEIANSILDKRVVVNFDFSNDLIRIRRLGKNIVIVARTRELAKEIRSAVEMR
ncbi:MAG: MoxR family ATPase [Candidatus Korarchaeota archaeon]|nr:MoxR family ATPase [Thermoproteota archaeon]